MLLLCNLWIGVIVCWILYWLLWVFKCKFVVGKVIMLIFVFVIFVIIGVNFVLGKVCNVVKWFIEIWFW